MATFDIDDYGDTWADLYIQNDHAYTRVYIRTADSSWSFDSKVFETEDASFYYPLEDLEPETDYVVNVGYNDDGSADVTWIGAQEFTTASSGGGTSGIALWNWDESNGEASPEQTQAAHEAITHGGSASDFFHLVWNDLCNKIAEVQEFVVGSDWATDGGGGLTLDETCMSDDDRVLTADRFNSMKYNLGRNEPTGIADVETGDPVLGSYFETITTVLNNWISSL